MICPFCMQEHGKNTFICPETRMSIPSVYVEDVNKGVPVFVFFTIGYSGHGKTCFFSSLFFSLYHGIIANMFPGLSFIGLNMETLNRIHDEYVNVLEHGNLPPKTPIMFPTPLIIKFQQIPFKVNSKLTILNPLGDLYKRSEVIFLFYDVGGGTFEVDEKIKQNLPILSNSNNLVFLIDLPKLIEEANTGISMHTLINTVCLAANSSGLKKRKKKKNILVCFTKADLMWGDKGKYGNLAERRGVNNIGGYKLKKYYKSFDKQSAKYSRYIDGNYRNFHACLINNFKSVRFTTFSSLGFKPDGNNIPTIAPFNVFEPILWALKFGKHI